MALALLGLTAAALGALVAFPPLLLLCAPFPLWIVWHAAAETTRWRLTQPAHSAVTHDLLLLQRINSGDLPVDDATFEVRGPDGVLVDDPDAAAVALLESQIKQFPPTRIRYP